MHYYRQFDNLPGRNRQFMRSGKQSRLFMEHRSNNPMYYYRISRNLFCYCNWFEWLYKYLHQNCNIISASQLYYYMQSFYMPWNIH